MAARLLTVSYDGSLRCMDPGAGCAFQVSSVHRCVRYLSACLLPGALHLTGRFDIVSVAPNVCILD